MEQAAERDQAVGGGGVGAAARDGRVGAALDEGDVDFAARLAQQGEVLGGAGGRPQPHLDPVLLQDLRVALAELGVGALVLAGGQRHLLRRRRIEQDVGQGDEADRQEHERRGGEEKLAQREQGFAEAFAHRRIVLRGRAPPARPGGRPRAILLRLCAFSSSKTTA